MNYQPVTCVWEVTTACKHCGSSCAELLSGELTAAEAIDVIGQMADIGLRWVTLSGGEPLARQDLPVLVKALSSRGIVLNIITNGWLVGPEMAESLAKNGIATAAISVDGTKEVHGRIRKLGAYDRLKESFRILRKHRINCRTVTTISYGRKCLKGCPNTRLTINKSIYSENQCCSYSLALGKSADKLKAHTDAGELLEIARRSAKTGEYQLCSQLLELGGGNAEAWRLNGFSGFMNGNYGLSEAAGPRALAG